MDTRMLKIVKNILSKVCQRETSSEPLAWSRVNPLWGHSDVVSLFIREMFGGDIICFSLKHIPRLEHLKCHYLNIFPDGTCEDFTFEQYYLKRFPIYGPADYPQKIEKEKLLSDQNFSRRYKIFLFFMKEAIFLEQTTIDGV